MEMNTLLVHIENCNNIKSADIYIAEGKTNIFFGKNGSGKSTIARAVDLISKGQKLDILRPYGMKVKDNEPKVTGISEEIIMVFNDEYVKQYVYQKNTVIQNAFDVLLRTPEYDSAKLAVDNELQNLRTVIFDDENIIRLINQLQLLTGKIKVGVNQQIDKRSAKGILEGKGAYFNPPKELESMKPFFEDANVTKWAIWRLQGYDQFGKKGVCPYCTSGDNEETETRNRIFSNSFDKSSVEIANLVLSVLEELREFVDSEKIEQLKSFFGTNGNISSLETHLVRLSAEANYLLEQLGKIRDFNGTTVNKDNLKELEKMLSEMKIDFTAIDSYFITAYTKEHLAMINLKLDELLSSIGKLKGEIGKYNKYLSEQIKNRTDDINGFLQLAGFKYHFDVKVDGEDNASARLEYILPDKSYKDLEAPDEHLSWGEKHAFALIMFMFDAISKNARVVILDDPISSFDRNKKYAIINRLFKTGDKNNSLYQRTVVLLTHDFEPVIDYIQTHSGRQDAKSNIAYYLENIDGNIICTNITDNEDMMSSVVLLKELAKDETLHIAARVGSLRKYIEHQFLNPREESNAYNILSSLMHGRESATKDNAGIIYLSDDEETDGTAFIREYISDFDYGTLLQKCSPEELVSDYREMNCSAYEKLLILRFYVERDEEARERLRKYNDVLRKYVDETFHIENDYLYTLDVRKFNIVPEEYRTFAEQFVANESARFDFTKEDENP